MLKIVKSNSKTSNNNTSLAVAILTINIAKLAAITLIILVIATLLKLITPIIAAPLKCSAYKAARGRASNSAS
jgi:hypothetical protein